MFCPPAVATLSLLKIHIMFCPPVVAKYPLFSTPAHGPNVSIHSFNCFFFVCLGFFCSTAKGSLSNFILLLYQERFTLYKKIVYNGLSILHTFKKTTYKYTIIMQVLSLNQNYLLEISHLLTNSFCFNFA